MHYTQSGRAFIKRLIAWTLMSYLKHDSHFEEEFVSNDFNHLCWWDKARFLFIMVPQRREGVTQLILIMVCMGFSNNLQLSHLSALWRTLVEPNRKHLLLSGKPPEEKVSQEVRMVGRAGAHARQGQVWLMAASFRGSFCFPAFSRINLQLSRLCPPLCSREEGKYLGLEGRAGWSKGWG